MQDNDLYIPTTITVCKDGVCLFEADCEVMVRYVDDHGELDVEVLSFHFDGPGELPKQRIHTAVYCYEPLFHVLAGAVNMQHLTNAVFDHIALNDIQRRNLLDV